MMFDANNKEGLDAAASQFDSEYRYWLDKLSGELQKTVFPYDYHQAVSGARVMDAVNFTIDGEAFTGLLKLSNASEPAIHMILAAVLVILLAKYTGNNDIIIAVPIYKQEEERKFINTVLPLRNQVNQYMTFKELLLQLKETIVEASKNQNYPIELLMDNLDTRHDNDDFSLFDVAILLENIHDKKYISHIPINMIISFLGKEEYMEGLVEYNASIYEVNTIKRIIGHYKQTLLNLLKDVNAKLSSIDILTSDEKKQLLSDFNATAAENCFTGTIHELFELQAGKTPDSIAGDEQGALRPAITYRELNEKSNLLAWWLRKNRVRGESVVGIMMEPSVDMVVVLLAILKAGGAYLPIEPGLPEERIRYMLEDSGATALVSTGKTVKGLSFTALQGFESRMNIEIKVTAVRPHIAGFDQLPRPNRRLISLKNYKNKIGMASVTDCISLQATRGCPYHCLFCHKIWSKHQVYRSAENIYKEIEYYHKQGVTNFAFIDDCFNLNIAKSRRLFELIIKNKLTLQLFFPNGLRGDIMTPGYIDLMVAAGTRGINLSLESASPRLQKLLKKYLDLERFKQVMDYIASRHPNVILEVASMHGFPTETEEEAMMTLDFIKNIKWLHFPYIHILKIFPNTEMEAFALEHGVSREDIRLSRNRAFHELPETLPFPKSFTRKYQADFLNNYFLNKERLMHVLPHQVKVLSETALVQKYNAYLPVEIKTIEDLIRFARLENFQVPGNHRDRPGKETGAALFDLGPEYPVQKPGAMKILLLDLSQHFSTHSMLYRVVEQPIGLISLLTYLKQRFADAIDGRIYKSGNDFDSFQELKALVDDYSPHLVGIRTLTYFREFFHETAALLKQWGVDVPIIAGGPYATSDYNTILKDGNINLAVLGEGEYTLAELVENMLDNDFKLPGPRVLENIKAIAYPGHPPVRDRGREILLLDRFNQTIPGKNSAKPGKVNHGHNLAYVMYTSGSTGKPKGVMVEHCQVNNCISWMQEKFNPGPGDVFINRTDLTFDPSVWEIFWPLYIGARVKILHRFQRKDAEFLIHFTEGYPGLTMMYCPATLVNMMTYLLNKRTRKPTLKFPWFIIGAEPIAMEVVKDFYKYYEGKIVNTYGPTECTINNTYYPLDRHCRRPVVPIGKPVANNQIYILDRKLQPVPLKTAGEICIAGNSVARGYINKPGKTNSSFIDNPFGKGKLYKTGDVGRWLEDGTCEIMGRLDEQVKIRGYRIELGDIQSILSHHPAVNECIVLVKERRDPQKAIKTCKTCGITTQYPNVNINPDGTCNICQWYSQNKQYIDGYFKTPGQLKQFIEEANKHKQGQYDCLLLYAGGRGAAYALYRLVDMGFNLLTATYDNGYFSRADMEHIKKITGSMGIDHVVLTHKNSDKIMGESIEIASTVCRGCFHTSSALAGEYAYRNGIPVVVGATLSRGQIIENRLFIFLQQGIIAEKELEKEILNLQESTPDIDKSIFDYIDIDIIADGSVHHQVKFLDFYRYFDIKNPDMIAYLKNQDPYWKNRKNFAIYSTNCPIKQMGDFGHLQERGYHYYGGATSWEKRLGHLALRDIREDLQCGVTKKGYERFLKRIGSRQRKATGNEINDTYLCAYFAADEELSVTQLREYLERELPHYMVPSYFVQLDRIPLTPNGKIDRKALPAPGIEREKDYVAPRDDIEKKLIDIWSDILEVEKEKISIDDNFFHLGGNSLNAALLGTRIHGKLHVNIPIGEIFQTPHLRGLAAYIKKSAKSKHIQVEPVEKKEYYPLSSAQRRLYILQQMDAEKGTAYNMPSAWHLEGDLDIEKFETVFHRLNRRHDSLRTFFTMVNDKPVQKIKEEIGIGHWSLVIGEAGKSDIEDIIKNFIKPFDLSRTPLLRVGLIKLLHTPAAPRAHPSQEGKEDRYLLMVDMHHIISDGLSMGIFVKEFMELYAGKRLPQLRLQYKDYSEWHNRSGEREYINEQEAYWLKQFAGEAPVLNIPTDYLRPSVQSFAGRTLHFEISKEETAALKSLTRERDVTLFMLLLSIYTVFLSKLSGQEDIVVGTPIAGRRYTDLEQIIGMFVNTLVLRNNPRGDKSFLTFLQEVKKNTLNAFENQDYSFEELVERASVPRDVSRNPLFDVMFIFQNMEMIKIKIPGLKLKLYEYENTISRFDLAITGVEIGNKLRFSIEYCTKLFKKETILGYINYFKTILGFLLENPVMRISGISIVPNEEKQQILEFFNDTAVEYPRHKILHKLIEEQGERSPDQVALLGPNLPVTNYKPQTHTAQMDTQDTQRDYVAITYNELNEKSNRLARLLKSKGIQPDTIVGIMMERSVEMMIAILSILKAGGAYLPIDPAYPGQRINYMLKESNTRVLLASPGTKIKTEIKEKPIEILDIANLLASSTLTSTSTFQVSPTNLAYVIYTSGSTGNPRGVMIKHRNVINFFQGMVDKIEFLPGKTILALTTISFDIFVLETLLPLVTGLKTVIASENQQIDPDALEDVLVKNDVRMVQFTPSRLKLVLSRTQELVCLQKVTELMVGGEPLPQDLFALLKKRFKGKIYNMYGPTETTVWSTLRDLTGIEKIDIGSPISNTCIYIVDQFNILQPVGMVGELCIAGDGVARGYLNNPELTSEKFVINDQCPMTPTPNHRLYHTGDLARWLSDGNIEFIGRIDSQVKIRGFRIEIEEIEIQLSHHDEINGVKVLARKHDDGEVYLCAYVTAARELSVTELREYLARRLPDYMIPSYFIQVEKIPLTPNGKVDRKALGSYVTNLDTGVQYTAPGNVTEQLIAATWKEVLHVNKVGVHDNFFDVGGHSLGIIRMNGKLNEIFQKKIPIVVMFRYPTIRTLAKYLDNKIATDISNEEIDRSLDIMEEATQFFIGDQDDE